jgi:hypothetical protein
MSCDVVNLTPLLYVIGMSERPLLLLIRGLLAMVATIFMISPVSCVDLLIILFPQGPLVVGLKELSLRFESLYEYVCDCEQITHHLGLLHGDLLHSLDITDPVTESIDDLDVLDVWDSILSIGEVLYIVPKALIVLLFDSLQGLSGRWTLVRALEVPNEHGT